MNAPIDVTNIRIETERLILRPWQDSDLEDFFEYARVEGVGEMAGWKHHGSKEESRGILAMFQEGKKTFALERKEDHKVIGSLGLEEYDEKKIDLGTLQGREVGYVLSRDCWGQGLMPEAVQAVIRYCLQTLHYDFLLCGHFEGNSQSRRVIEKCGFSYVKNIPYETRMGTIEDTRLYIRYSDNLVTGPFDATKVTLETERLILRPLQEGDVEDFHEIVSDPEIADLSGFECRHSLAETRAYLNRMIRCGDILAADLKENGKMVGIFALRSRCWEKYPISPTLIGRECGFELNRSYWGRGLMPEALRAVTSYCFDALHYDFITASYFPRNTRSSHMIQKCGYALLFEDNLTLPGDRKERVHTYICYNPNKEIPNV